MEAWFAAHVKPNSLSVVAVSGIPAAAAGTRDSCAPAKLSSLPEPPRPTVASILTFSWFCDAGCA